MRDHIQLHINGEELAVGGGDALLTLADYLRIRCRLTGTKVVCSEGDCGSCSVLCGQPSDSEVTYRPIDSCIRFMYQLDGTHIVTIEGLKEKSGQLTAIQQAMIDCHGSQCGFCTPGFVVAMSALPTRDGPLTEEHLRHHLTGNLCRCTGYSPIIQAGLQACGQRNLNREFSVNGASRQDQPPAAVEITASLAGRTQRVGCPVTIAEAVAFLNRYPNAKIVAGATDIGVQVNKGHVTADVWLDLNRVDELTGVALQDDHWVAGARATWTDIGDLIQTRLPQFYEMISIFGSPQIRHVGTIGGNIVNASPIADSLPFLFACGAQLTMVSQAGERTVDINDFYRGYKDFDLRPGELLTQVRVPLPPENRIFRLYKVSRRRDLDISSFTGAIWVELANQRIADAGIVYGAVGPVVLRLNQTEDFLRGLPFTLETMTQAGDVAVQEISPISDVRGSADYRLQLARNVLKKFYYQIEQTELSATA